MVEQNITANLAQAHAQHRAGHFARAAEGYRRILEVEPRHPLALHLLGLLLAHEGDRESALPLLRRAAQAASEDPHVHHNLAATAGEHGLLDEAVVHYERAIELDPTYALAWKNLAVALQRLARLEEAIAAAERAVALDPSLRGTHSNLLFLLNHSAEASRTRLMAAHHQWAQHHADPMTPPALHGMPQREVGRPLRVGYVSPDFRAHPIAYFIEPLLAAHDRNTVAVVCYANVEQPDAVTERLRGLSDRWRNIAGVDDDAVCRQIRADSIDVLVDLAGHTRGHRLRVFAQRPAPVQLSYLGYPHTSGIAAIDARISDAVADPDDEPLEGDPVVRLPGGFLCYRPPAGAPPILERPVPEGGAITFGSFNKALKLTPPVIALWARVLRALPASKLLLKSDTFAHASARASFADAFAREGVARGRLRLVPAEPTAEEHLARYGEIDVALDPFPYNGATTTCEALWMGVPVVALAGERHAARVSASILTAAGLRELVADTADDYVAIARALAREPARIVALREGMRDQLLDSPLCDAQRVAQALEHAYLERWAHTGPFARLGAA